MKKKSFLTKIFNSKTKARKSRSEKKTAKKARGSTTKATKKSHTKTMKMIHKKHVKSSVSGKGKHESKSHAKMAHKASHNKASHNNANHKISHKLSTGKGGKNKFSKPFVLLVVDGYGVRQETEGNALACAKMPFLAKAMDNNCSLLEASGTYVGLPQGIPGSCEVGHATIAAGRIIPQDLTLINKAIDDGSFFKHPVFLDAIKRLKENPNSSVHLVGVLSDAGITSHINHLFALIELGHHHYIPHVYVHAILDGRDSEVMGSKRYLRQLERQIEKIGWGEIATVIGRSYALDTKNKEKKEHKAYELMVQGKGTLIRDPQEAVNLTYRDNLGDEYVKPTIINPNGLIKQGDVVIFFNFRGDSSREFIRSFTKGAFRGFKRKETIPTHMICISDHHDPEAKMHCILPPQKTVNTLGEVLEHHKKHQVRITSDESFAKVTDFFDFNPKPFAHEHRVLIHDQGDDLKKQLQALVAATKKEIKKKRDFYLINMPQLQEVAYESNFNQTVQTASEVDAAIAAISKEVDKAKGTLIITSDHGNAEYTKDQFGRDVPANTSNPVPFMIIGNGIRLEQHGSLADVAPTILSMMKIQVPRDMTGKSLVRK